MSISSHIFVAYWNEETRVPAEWEEDGLWIEAAGVLEKEIAIRTIGGTKIGLNCNDKTHIVSPGMLPDV